MGERGKPVCGRQFLRTRGTNCHIILEEYVPERMKGKERPLYLVPLSAKTETSLISYTDKLLNQLKKTAIHWLMLRIHLPLDESSLNTAGQLSAEIWRS